jgi:two-component system sensor histidine kinase ChvG
MLDKTAAPEALERNESDEGQEVESFDLPVAGRPSLLHRLAPQRLASRIVLLNLLGLVILVTGILYFNQFRQGLIDAKPDHPGPDHCRCRCGLGHRRYGLHRHQPDSLETTDPYAPDADQLDNLDFPINPETTGPVLRRLLANSTIRGRIIDPEGNLVVDSRFLYGGGDIIQSDLPPRNASTPNILVRWWNAAYDWFFAYDYPLQKEYSLDNGKDFPGSAAALNGAVVSVVRLDEKHDIIVLVSVPVQRFRAVLGALVLSTSGGEIDNVLRAERRVVLLTFGFVALVTILLSVFLAGTIAEPIRRLSAAAERVRRGINKRVEIPDFTARRDEIGHLSGALRDMTGALYNRIDAIEAFAADVSHELKNPLTRYAAPSKPLPW